MTRTKEKKPVLTKEQKKALKQEKKQRFMTELRNGAEVCYTHRWNIFAWISCYLMLALISMFFTGWTVSDSADFPGVIYNVFPRAFSLMLTTFFAFATKCRRTAFFSGATVWAVWMLLLSDVSYGLPVIIGIIGFAVAAVFFKAEIINGRESMRSDVMIKLCKWFYFFAALTLLVELVHRIDTDIAFLNIYAPFVSVIKNPDILGINMLVVVFSGLFIFICPKKRFAAGLFAFLWVTVAFISFLKYNNVYEPALLLDIFQIPDAIAAVKRNYPPIAVILVLIAFVGLCVLIGFVAKKEKSIHVNACSYVFITVAAIILVMSFFGVRNLSYTESVGKFVRGNYFRFGFPFSFVNYAFDSQVSAPDDYTELRIDEVLSAVEEEYSAPTEKKEVQNVIVIQMESFCDPYLFAKQYENLEFERDPMPFLRSLSDDYSTGKINVPVFGGQTVKSEFEFLTGMTLNNFPSGYNPYVTYLNENSVDNLVRYFRGEGYTATAVHNYQGEFFSRNDVYGYMGFNTFIPYECMSGIEKREGSIWADDQRFVDEIEKVLDSTEGKDFVYGITVQLHGNYNPIEKEDYTMKIDGIDDELFEGSLAYYVSQLEEFDAAMKNLIDMLSEREEPTYVLMYSDHLPKLFYNVDNMTENEKFTTQYFTWNNIGLEKFDANTDLSKLSTRLCNDLSITGTFINKFHSVYAEKSKEEYETAQSIVDYYLLMDNVNLDEFANPDYKIGLYPLSLSAIVPEIKKESESFGERKTNSYIIHGNEITENTVITINGHVYDLTFIDANTARLDLGKQLLKTGDVVSLRIIGERAGVVFCESRKSVYNAETNQITWEESVSEDNI